jgi:hypothetical protein
MFDLPSAKGANILASRNYVCVQFPATSYHHHFHSHSPLSRIKHQHHGIFTSLRPRAAGPQCFLCPRTGRCKTPSHQPHQLPLTKTQAADIPAAGEPVQQEASPNLAVKVSATFPQAEVFGIKLVNGHPTTALLNFVNEEAAPVQIAVIGGSLWGPDPATQGATSKIVRNITATRYGLQIPAGEKESVSYSFATELHPQDLRLELVAVVTTEKGVAYTLQAFNETVSVVEADASIFDPQM